MPSLAPHFSRNFSLLACRFLENSLLYLFLYFCVTFVLRCAQWPMLCMASGPNIVYSSLVIPRTCSFIFILLFFLLLKFLLYSRKQDFLSFLSFGSLISVVLYDICIFLQGAPHWRRSYYLEKEARYTFLSLIRETWRHGYRLIDRWMTGWEMGGHSRNTPREKRVR